VFVLFWQTRLQLAAIPKKFFSPFLIFSDNKLQKTGFIIAEIEQKRDCFVYPM
jgi:hypothetical protein